MKLQETEITEKLKTKFADLSLELTIPENGDHYIIVPADKTDVIMQFLKETPELDFDYFMSVSAFDNKEQIEVTYHLHSYQHRHTIILKAKVARENGQVKTACHLYGAANFQEREVYDHFGVNFQGHPDMRRILLPQDWVGYPLLKDYVEQEDYNGIGTTRPSML